MKEVIFTIFFLLFFFFDFFKGNDVEKNFSKALELYEKSHLLGNIYATNNLALLYELGDGVEKDFDKAAFYYHKSYLLSKESPSPNHKLSTILKSKKVNWCKEYHQFWDAAPLLNSQIVLLFLVSKFRNESSLPYVLSMVKGITLKIVKYLCHFQQKDSN